MTTDLSEALNDGKRYISYNILMQVFMRGISFLCNAVILRSLSGYVFGVINVRLLLMYTTIHCFCREPIRRCCMGMLEKSDDIQKVVNLIWFPIPLCVAMGCICRIIWKHMLTVPDPNQVQNYDAAVDYIIISLFIETLAEPLHIVGVNFHFIKLKVVSEGLLNTTRSITMALMVHKNYWTGIDAFCFSQILSSSLYTLVYYSYFIYFMKRSQSNDNFNSLPFKSILEIFPRLRRKFVDFERLKLVWSFFKQTLLKQLLTEGEKYLMTVFNVLSFPEQGVYEIVNNLGSLVARLIFLPIEESTYNIFSILLHRTSADLQKKKNLDVSARVLQNAFKFMIMVGLTSLAFGFPYSRTLLFLYGGQALSDSKALVLLKWHCFYIIFIALNGVTESFVFSVMTATQIDKRNIFTVLLSLTFLFLAYFLTKAWGAIGFVMANCVNMALRTCYSLNFIEKYFGHANMRWFYQDAIPYSFVLWATYAFCFIIASLSEAFLCCTDGIIAIIFHMTVGLCCFILVIRVIYVVDRKFVDFIKFNLLQDTGRQKNN